MRWPAKPLFVLALLLFVRNPQVAEAKDDVRIISLSPETTKPLRAGATINLEIEVRIDADATIRFLSVGAYRGRERGAEILAAWTEAIPKGEATRTFKATIRVPVTGEISVLAAIGEGIFGKRALAYDASAYSVVDKSGKKINATPASKDMITIRSISPTSGSTLRAGDTVSFDLKVEYDLRSAETGRVVWGFFSGGDPYTILSSTPVRKGKGTIFFNRALQIRHGLGVDQATFVLLQAQDSTFFALDRKNFQVQQSRESPQNTTSRITIGVASEFEDHVKITSIVPRIEMPFRSGETIDFEVTVEYELNSVDMARIDLRFGYPSSYGKSNIVTALDSRIIERGRGSLMIVRRLWIPPGSNNAFPVTVGLSPPAYGTDTVTYSLAPSR